jgi:hypothetical protein
VWPFGQRRPFANTVVGVLQRSLGFRLKDDLQHRREPIGRASSEAGGAVDLLGGGAPAITPNRSPGVDATNLPALRTRRPFFLDVGRPACVPRPAQCFEPFESVIPGISRMPLRTVSNSVALLFEVLQSPRGWTAISLARAQTDNPSRC